MHGCRVAAMALLTHFILQYTVAYSVLHIVYLIMVSDVSKSSNAIAALSPRAKANFIRLGKNIKLARAKRSITQAELAQRASVSPVTVGKLEKGDPTVGINVLLMVLDVLGLCDDILHVAASETDTLGNALHEAVPSRVRPSKPVTDLDF